MTHYWPLNPKPFEKLKEGTDEHRWYIMMGVTNTYEKGDFIIVRKKFSLAPTLLCRVDSEKGADLKLMSLNPPPPPSTTKEKTKNEK